MMQQATKPTASRAAYFRAWRSKRKTAKQTARAKVLPEACKWPEHPGLAIAQWSREKLVVPVGHPRSGEALVLPDFLVDFLVDVYRNPETALLVARKNSKSTAVSVAMLAHLIGPLRKKGFRAGVISLTALKASELKDLMHGIAVSSGLEGLRFLRSPAPGRVESEWGRVEIYALEKASGHSSSFDISIAEELGLYKPRDRDAVSGMRSAVSAKGGRFVSLSVVGSSEYVKEILERHKRGEPGLAVHLHAAPPDCALDDRAAWKMANPALGIAKQWKYMETEARRVKVTVSDQASFRALELNQQQDPAREMVASVTDWLACLCEPADLPARAGACFVGADIGSGTSMSAAAVYWPRSFRLELFAALPVRPSLSERGEADGCGNLYSEAHRHQEIELIGQKVVELGTFFQNIAARLDGCDVQSAGSDLYRKSEVEQALTAESIPWPWEFQRVGSGPTGSASVRAFQRAVLRCQIRTRPSRIMGLALRSAVLIRDSNGNPSIDRGRGRIDVLSATIIAVGLAQAASGESEFGITRRAVV